MTQPVLVLYSDVFAEVLCSGDHSRCLAELDEVPASSLWPRNSTLRALASLLSAEDPHVNKAAADYLSSGASRSHFRTRVSKSVCVYNILNSPDRCSKSCLNVSVCLQAVECYTQALSEAGGQNQRTACSALSCLQVSGLSVYHNMPYVCKKSGLPPSSFLLYLLAV